MKTNQSHPVNRYFSFLRDQKYFCDRCVMIRQQFLVLVTCGVLVFTSTHSAGEVPRDVPSDASSESQKRVTENGTFVNAVTLSERYFAANNDFRLNLTAVAVNHDSESVPEPVGKIVLDYKPQKPVYAGEFSSGQLGQLIPPGKPWPADPPPPKPPALEDRFQEVSTATTQQSSTNRPLLLNPGKPTFAGEFSSGQLGQLIPPGKPWPADPQP